MFYITKENLHHLLLGSSFLATGGGLPYNAHKKFFTDALNQKKRLAVKGADEFKSSGCLVSVYLVGDPTKSQLNFGNLIRKALREYTNLTGIKIQGIIPGEINGEGVAFQASAYANLPVVDSDLVGGRAAPEIQMDVFAVYKIPLTPILAVTLNNKSIVLLENFSAKEVEDLLRGFFKENGGAGLLVGYSIKAGDYAKIGTKKTLSHSIKIGQFLEKKNLSVLLQELQGKVIATEKIQKIDLKSKGDFLEGFIYFKNFKIFVKNENVILFKNSKKIVVAPDLIVLLGKDFTPIHNVEISKYREGEVTILYIPAWDYWQERENRKIWSSALE